MKKTTVMYSTLIAILFLSGCVTINPTEKLSSALKISAENKIKLKITDNAAKSNICFATDPLSTPIKTLAQNSVIQKLKEDLAVFKILNNKENTNLDESKFRLWFFQPGGFLATINELQNDLFSENVKLSKGDDELRKILLQYINAYLDGEFVLRNGAKLAMPGKSTVTYPSKPDSSTPPKLPAASVDNDTVTGLATVILEALFDHCLRTPVYGYTTQTENYKPIYVAQNPTDKDSKYNLIHYEKIVLDSDDFLFGEGNSNIPTALVSGQIDKVYMKKCDQMFGKDEEKKSEENEEKINKMCRKDNSHRFKEEFDNDETTGKMTGEKLLAIRRLTDLWSETNKIVAGSSFKSFGGLGFSFFGYLKFSFGDNDSLHRLVETIASVITRRETEHFLYRLVENKNNECNGNCQKEVTKMLKIIALKK